MEEYKNSILHNGDCIEVLKIIEDCSIDLVVTSPPYDDLRTYDGYSFQFEDTARELTRVLKPGGVIVWIVGDSCVKGSESLTSFKQAIYFKDECGLNMHDSMIWEKPNFSNPSSNRYHQIFEYMFILVKGKPKTFNPIMDVLNKTSGGTCLGENTTRNSDGSFERNQKKSIVKEFGMRRNIWKNNTAGQDFMCQHLPHPAMFPESIARDHILSWSNEGDVVLDPFMGSGTTGVACFKTNRNFIGIEISTKYFEDAKKRIETTQFQPALI